MDPYDDPFSMERTVMDMKLDFYTRQAIRDPRAQMVVANIPEPPPTIFESDLVPDGNDAWYLSEWGKVLLPMYDRYGERTGLAAFMPTSPKLSFRWTLGAREARRARRRQRKGLR